MTESPTDILEIDRAASVNARQPGSYKTFDKYTDEVILPDIEHCAQWHARIAIVLFVCIMRTVSSGKQC